MNLDRLNHFIQSKIADEREHSENAVILFRFKNNFILILEILEKYKNREGGSFKVTCMC